MDVLECINDAEEYRLVQSDGSIRWVSLCGRVFFDEQDEPVRFPGVGVNLTTEREAIDALREAIDALREAAKRKDEFLATLAHELRNPLAPIRSALNLLKIHPCDGQVDGSDALYCRGGERRSRRARYRAVV